MSVNSPRKSGAFTLIEALMVMALLLVLLLLALPGYRIVQESGRATRCLSNLRTVGQVVLTYATENKGSLIPAVELRPPNYTSGSPWNSLLDEYGYFPKESYTGLKNGVMTCPSRGVPGTYIYNQMHYGMNRSLGFDNINLKGNPFFRMTRIADFHRTMLLVEVRKDYMLQSHTQAQIDNNAIFPHREQCHAFFADGHAETLTGPWKVPKKGDSYPFY